LRRSFIGALIRLQIECAVVVLIVESLAAER